MSDDNPPDLHPWLHLVPSCHILTCSIFLTCLLKKLLYQMSLSREQVPTGPCLPTSPFPAFPFPGRLRGRAGYGSQPVVPPNPSPDQLLCLRSPRASQLPIPGGAILSWSPHPNVSAPSPRGTASTFQKCPPPSLGRPPSLVPLATI